MADNEPELCEGEDGFGIQGLWRARRTMAALSHDAPVAEARCGQGGRAVGASAGGDELANAKVAEENDAAGGDGPEALALEHDTREVLEQPAHGKGVLYRRLHLGEEREEPGWLHPLAALDGRRSSY